MKLTPWKVFEKEYPPSTIEPDGSTTYDIRGCDDWCILPNLKKELAYELVREVNERPYLLDLIRRMIDCFGGCYYTAKLPAVEAFNLLAEAKDAIKEAADA
jgi:hypothetical protein